MVLEASPSVRAFVAEHLDNFMKWQLLRYFYTHQHVADTASQIAGYVGRNVNVVRKQLRELVESGVIHQVDFEDLAIFTLTEDEDLRSQLDDFMNACDERMTHLQVIYQIMEQLR